MSKKQEEESKTLIPPEEIAQAVLAPPEESPGATSGELLSADPSIDKELRKTVEAAIGSAIGPEEARAQVVDRVVRIVAREHFRGPLPHPRHLKAYEDICPGLANRIVALTENARARKDDRLDRAMNLEYQDRRLGMHLGFFALLALLLTGIIVLALGQTAIGAPCWERQ